MTTQGQDHCPRFIYLSPISLRFNIFRLLFLKKTLGCLKPNFIWSLHGMLGWKFVQIFRVAWPRWLPGPYMVKTLKISFFGTERLMTLKLGIQHQILKYYQICSNYDTGLTLTIFMTWSNCFLMLLHEWMLIQHIHVVMYFQAYSNSAYPQLSCEQYRTSGPLVLHSPQFCSSFLQILC